jgi:hypothetical protein
VTKAVPRTPPQPEPDPVRKYRVLTRRCVWGKKGETIERAFSPGVELCLIQAGTLERVPDEPEVVTADEPADRPLKSAERKDERHG